MDMDIVMSRIFFDPQAKAKRKQRHFTGHTGIKFTHRMVRPTGIEPVVRVPETLTAFPTSSKFLRFFYLAVLNCPAVFFRVDKWGFGHNVTTAHALKVMAELGEQIAPSLSGRFPSCSSPLQDT